MAVRCIPGDAKLRPDFGRTERVVVIGAGGVGGILARHLVTLLGVADRRVPLVIVDGDEFEARNRERMLFRGWRNKAQVLVEELGGYCADAGPELIAVPEYLNSRNVAEIVRERDLVFLCVDNHASRRLVGAFVAGDGEFRGTGGRREVWIVSGGNDGAGVDGGGTLRRGTYGNVQIYVRREGKDLTPSLTALHPEIAVPRDRVPGEGCQASTAATPQLLVANAMVASWMLSAAFVLWCGELGFVEVEFDVVEGVMARLLPGDLGLESVVCREERR